MIIIIIIDIIVDYYDYWIVEVAYTTPHHKIDRFQNANSSGRQKHCSTTTMREKKNNERNAIIDAIAFLERNINDNNINNEGDCGA